MAELSDKPFLFLRHGATDWNTRGLTQGRTDVSLNEAGLAQAHQAAARLAGSGVRRIVCSTLDRARTTAAIVSQALHLDLLADPDLREACFGDQEGKPMGHWYDDWVAGTYTPEGAETFADLCTRAVGAVARAQAGPGPVLIVAHGAFFRAIRQAMGHSPLVRTDNGIPIRCDPPAQAGTKWTLTELS